MKFFKSDFFTDNEGRQSMSRLLTFLAFWPASAVLINESFMRGVSDMLLAAYLAPFAGAYALGKFADREQKNVDSPD